MADRVTKLMQSAVITVNEARTMLGLAELKDDAEPTQELEGESDAGRDSNDSENDDIQQPERAENAQGPE
jgi:hypothetical protein